MWPKFDKLAKLQFCQRLQTFFCSRISSKYNLDSIVQILSIEMCYNNKFIKSKNTFDSKLK